MKKQELFNNVTEGFLYQRQPQKMGLYDAAYEHDACGVGMLVNIHGEKSHDIVESALKVLENMRHRGAEGADNKTGDGAGIMLQIPHEFILLQGIPVPEKGRYGTGLLFLPKNEKDQAAILSIIIEEIEKEGLTLMHLRNVPTCPEILGESALANEPDIKQVFITGFTETETADRKLYLIRKRIENKVRLSSIPAKDDFYVVSLSTKSITYKGMLSSLQLRNYYPDLTNSYFTSGLALVHSRFSTNTFPTWGLAQPFRLLAHNGEINTIRGNRGWMEARESVLSTPTLGDIKEIRPIIQPGMSDSASLDNVLEFLVMSGLSLPHAMAMLVPESFNEKNPISEDLKSFYEYHSILMEPWDGPAALLFSDGRFAGGMLDRNGLRPARYLITKNDMMVVASEVGVMDFEPGDIKEKGRLQPGKILLVDTEKGEIYYDGELKKQLAAIQDSINYENAVSALEKSNFVLEADQLLFKRGGTAFVSSNTNFVSLSDNRAIVQVAPFNGGGLNGVGGITVEGSASNVKVQTDKKGNTTLSMNVMGTGISATVNIFLFKGSNYASVVISPNYNSNRITLRGRLVPKEYSTVFKGSSF